MLEFMMLRCISCGALNRVPYSRAGQRARCGQCGSGFRAPQALDGPVDVSDGSFDREVREAKTPVLVEFWSPSCGHCIRMEPVISELARELTGRVKVVKADISSNPRAASDYEIRATPALLLFNKGSEGARFFGAMPKEELLKMMRPYLEA